MGQPPYPGLMGNNPICHAAGTTWSFCAAVINGPRNYLTFVRIVPLGGYRFRENHSRGHKKKCLILWFLTFPNDCSVGLASDRLVAGPRLFSLSFHFAVFGRR